MSSESAPPSSAGANADKLSQVESAPSIASTSTISQTNSSNGPSATTKESSHSHSHSHSHSFSSLFHPSRYASEPKENTLGAMLAPAVNIAGAHNPFVIGGMREDGSRTRPHFHRRGSSDDRGAQMMDDADSVTSDDTSRSVSSQGKKSKKGSKRHRIRSAFGRTLSPWTFHSDAASDKKKGSAFSFSRVSCRDSLDFDREKKKDGESGGERGSGTESDAESIKGGITPRNNAFGAPDSDDSDTDEAGGESYVSASKASKAERERKAREKKDTADNALQSSDSIPDELEAEGGRRHKDGREEEEDEEREDSGEESDDYIDFDEQTLDNTLYNAGCIDLHDAWLKQDGHHSHAAVSPDEAKNGGHATLDDYYGPNDYDAAVAGAGPTGHDEADETLRAPNVVIGQSDTLSPSQLTGEGMDVLRESTKPERRSSSPFRRPRSRPSSVSSSLREPRPSSSTSATSEAPSKEGSSETKTTSKSSLLTASRPVFERNRCTITLIHGEYDRFAEESNRPKRYIVASDGSEESSYAIEWTIGTVLRDGDEMLVVSVMETDAKLDSVDPKHEDKAARQEHQRIRQSMAIILARRATAVLQRTRLAVKVSCQALHARNARHMFIDMIDFFEPTMCVVGSRGLNSLKGVLLGSFSNYCVQKSPVPVMVARKRLKLPALPRGKGDVVSNVRARHMRLDEAMIDKDANVAAEKPENEQEKEKKAEEEGEDKREKGKIGDSGGGSSTSKSEDGQVEQGAGDDSIDSSSGGITEAEKVKQAANVPSIVVPDEEGGNTTTEESAATTPANSSAEKVEEQSIKKEGGVDTPPTRGRAKFNLDYGADDDDDDEDSRGRSRSRTPDVHKRK